MFLVGGVSNNKEDLKHLQAPLSSIIKYIKIKKKKKKEVLSIQVITPITTETFLGRFHTCSFSLLNCQDVSVVFLQTNQVTSWEMTEKLFVRELF